MQLQAAEMTLWARLFIISWNILRFGAILGLVAHFLYRREFRQEELGMLAWPLTVAYLAAFVYYVSYLVFVVVKGRLRYVAIALWLLVVALTAVGIVALAFQ